MLTLDDYKKVKRLADLYSALDYYCEMVDQVKDEIRNYAVSMSPKDIKYAIKLSERK